MSDEILITTPVGRIVQGDVYKGSWTNQKGVPHIYKSGAKIGQPYQQFYIGLAIPKNQGVPWENEPWGQVIMQQARAANPGRFDPNTGFLIPGVNMAFKVQDGDSQLVDKKQKRWCDKPGFPGHWVLSMNRNEFPPVTAHMENGAAVALVEPIIKRGHFVEIRMGVKGHATDDNPGVYLNPTIVNHIGYGEEIVGGPDINSAGFGQSVVPDYVSQIPIGTQPQQQHITAGMTIPAGQVQQQVPQQQVPQQQVPQQQVPQQQVPQQQVPQQQVPQQQVPQQQVPQQQVPQQQVPQQQVPQQQVPQQQVPQQQVVPANDLVNQQVAQQQAPQQVEESYNLNGMIYTRTALLALPGWNESNIINLPRV